ncbi:hypothetical protein LTR91_004730 [Friedmanniomyces endolithicus]|uniref:Uncharacterized protein n=1 Tax=Friedmanniomyces endolithicus TaxID=329885 RepID=A0AAN6QXL8_9PEZI|nr:hypothetical protein LTR35_016967 [Friedmanniomyces endolithicus]KAK0271728.1 hypothetical protein LTS00_016509 [Friedmanniomyces endolithicus]KAK0920585.1 hypothetical protein LTR57_009635 [Friedmanniomyces endolithicus]KAK0975906.1 hypothetical protein LTR54_016683 [Friedmanniomyces endolithicus]KAK0981988.1 hypothetical protein LTS01_011557 [Friedmanniomyces endolithicus]
MSITRKPLPGLANTGVPTIYPLHVNRFTRRTGSAVPLRAETPLYRSMPDPEALIHAPQPKKSIPMLDRQSPSIQQAPTVSQTPPTTIDDVTPAEKATKTVRVTSPYVRNSNFALHSPAAYLHGTKDKCVRHGRKRELRATNDMQDKGRTGAYHPTGFTVRQQTEATSPWSIASLTHKQGLADPCPDCRAELGIRRREAMQTVMRPADGGASSRVIEPVLEAAGPAEKTAPRQREKSRQPRSTRETSNAEPHDELVVTRDLGDGLDAAILARGGELERVIINTRMVRPTGDALVKLSRDLLSVSRALAATSDGSPAAVVNDSQQGRTVVFNTPSRGRRRRYSVSELLDLVDQAVDTMHDSEQENEVSEPAGRGLVSSEIFHEDELQKAARDPKKPEPSFDAAGKRNTTQDARAETVQQEPAKTARFTVSPATTTRPHVLSSAVSKVLATPDATGRAPEVTKPITASSNLLTSTASTIASAAKPTAMQAATSLLPPIAFNPQPYHHAPATPRSLNVGQWADKRVQEAQQAARKAVEIQRKEVVVTAGHVGQAVGMGEEGVKIQGGSGVGKVARVERAVVGGVLGLFGAGGHPSAGR